MPGFRPLGRMGRALGASKRSSTAAVAGRAFTTVGAIFGAGSPTGFTDPGTYNFTVPSGVTLLRAKMWGAPGGAAGAPGGPGGYVEVDIPVTPGEILTIILPSAGNGTVAGSPGGGAGDYLGAGGGGFAAIKRGATFLAIAPGGGGGGDQARGGAGGLIGGDGVSLIGSMPDSYNGKGGTQTAGGLNGNATGPTATQYRGANWAGGGAGGGGFYGGGSGVLYPGVGRGGGGGGSAFTHPTLVAPQYVLRGDTNPPKMDDPHYGGNAGRPDLGFGRIVILY